METIPLYPAECVCIAVVKLTSLIGVGSSYKVRLFAELNDDLIRIVEDLGGSEGNRPCRMYWGGGNVKNRFNPLNYVCIRPT